MSPLYFKLLNALAYTFTTIAAALVAFLIPVGIDWLINGQITGGYPAGVFFAVGVVGVSIAVFAEYTDG